jgi:hypothetical protein
MDLQQQQQQQQQQQHLTMVLLVLLLPSRALKNVQALRESPTQTQALAQQLLHTNNNVRARLEHSGKEERLCLQSVLCLCLTLTAPCATLVTPTTESARGRNTTGKSGPNADG